MSPFFKWTVGCFQPCFDGQETAANGASVTTQVPTRLADG